MGTKDSLEEELNQTQDAIDAALNKTDDAKGLSKLTPEQKQDEKDFIDEDYTNGNTDWLD